jgi:hypothetical protein
LFPTLAIQQKLTAPANAHTKSWCGFDKNSLNSCWLYQWRCCLAVIIYGSAIRVESGSDARSRRRKQVMETIQLSLKHDRIARLVADLAEETEVRFMRNLGNEARVNVTE